MYSKLYFCNNYDVVFKKKQSKLNNFICILFDTVFYLLVIGLIAVVMQILYPICKIVTICLLNEQHICFHCRVFNKFAYDIFDLFLVGTIHYNNNRNHKHILSSSSLFTAVDPSLCSINIVIANEDGVCCTKQYSIVILGHNDIIVQTCTVPPQNSDYVTARVKTNPFNRTNCKNVLKYHPDKWKVFYVPLISKAVILGICDSFHSWLVSFMSG
ncbi:hypothetical protein AGLY_002753 [Aphis glycines]|uniref:Uncharacterized protein n=1 Tax=Aphis glycines TaxID=307491 RepID=A0A6G0U3I7_APHGL|nr:hypothetical protein AGLY_002753 [Aphis glycines]